MERLPPFGKEKLFPVQLKRVVENWTPGQGTKKQPGFVIYSVDRRGQFGVAREISPPVVDVTQWTNPRRASLRFGLLPLTALSLPEEG